MGPAAEVLAGLDGADDVLDVLERLLLRAEARFADDDWLAFRTRHRGALDAVGEAVEAELLATCVPLVDDAEAVFEALAAAWEGTGDDPAVLVVAAARAIDRAFGTTLDEAWVRRVARAGRVAPGSLVVLAEVGHLAELVGRGSVAAPFTRADERADRTRRTLLFRPPPGAPALTVTTALGAALDAVLARGARLATCHPVPAGEAWSLAFPARPPTGTGPDHVRRCVDLLVEARGRGASVVVLPELVGYDTVTDALRRAEVTGPLLVLAGSGHVGAAGRRRNESLMWLVDGEGRTTPARRVLKRVPYEGAAGAEELDELATSIEVVVSERWRLAVAICRDGIQSSTVAALRDAGVNLLLVPAWTPKTTNLGGDAGRLANTVPGFSVVANGVALARDRAGAEVPVPLALFGVPVDRGARQHDVTGTPPCVVVYDPGDNSVTCQPPG